MHQLGSKLTLAEALAMAQYVELVLREQPEEAMAGAERLGVIAEAAKRLTNDRDVKRALVKVGPMRLPRVDRKVGAIRQTPQRVRTAPQAGHTPAGDVIVVVSKKLCETVEELGVFGGCTADTISAEIANRKQTTVQGAHAWILAPLAGTPGIRNLAIKVLVWDGRFGCAEGGPLSYDEQLRFLPEARPWAKARRILLAEKEKCRHG